MSFGVWYLVFELFLGLMCLSANFLRSVAKGTYGFTPKSTLSILRFSVLILSWTELRLCVKLGEALPSRDDCEQLLLIVFGFWVLVAIVAAVAGLAMILSILSSKI